MPPPFGEPARDLALAGALGLAAAALYTLQAAPGVYVGDSGELVTAAATFGLAHPTGYPLYLLLGRAWMTLLPFTSPAHAMNLLSAACGGLAVATIVLLARALGSGRAAAALAGVLLAGLESFWAEATVARVYTPNLALMLLAALMLARLRQEATPRRLHLAFLFTGLALAVHTVSLALAPALLLGLADRRLARGPRARAALWLLPGLSVYLYVPLASSFEPAQNWGDPSTLDRLLRYLSREEYWQRAWIQSAADLRAALAHYAAILPRELGWLGLALVPAGAWRLARTARWSLAALLAVAGLTLGLVLAHGSANDLFHWDRYVLPALAALVLLAALGADEVATRVPPIGRRSWLLPALALAPLALKAPALDRSRFTLAEACNRRILERLPSDAVLIADGDNQLFPLSYLHHALGVRPDVDLVLQGINVLTSMPIDPARTPVFFTHYFDLGAPQLRLLPEGLVYRLHPIEGPPPPEVRWADWAVPELEDPSGQGTLDFLARSLVGDYQLMKAQHYERRHPLAARDAVRVNLATAHDNPVNAVNGGLLLERLGLLREAEAAFARALAEDARNEVAARHLPRLRAQLARPAPPDQIRARLAEATARFQAGAVDDARRILTEAVRSWPSSDRLHYNLGALALQAGDYPEALRQMLVTLDLKPDDELARRDVAELDRRLAR